MKELDKRFDFKSIDAKWADQWVADNTYQAKPNPDKKPYTIMIPPPNVTGILHMGHALNNTLQDIIIRYKRMRGYEALWMVGTDHAGIATQNVLEKQLAKEGKARDDLGRQAFLERLWEWKKQYGGTIIHQLKKLGASCDWQRERFTMDDDYSLAVQKVFIHLYEKGLIYQGQYIINWCPRCQTALSDEEAEHQDHKGTLTHIRYPFKDQPDQHVIVATTRPETMLGDTAIAVNPNDERYKGVIGKMVVLPIMNREIPIIADEFVDPAFGTGVVKVTPAHDPNDFQMGKRHNLEFINILQPNGLINEHGGKYHGLDRFQARKLIVADLKDHGFFEKVEDHAHAVSHCYRCDTVVEPYLSKQWFVKMAPLAKPAIEAVEQGKIKFHPQRWTKVYMNWMENIRDWCISRQIWWGHRIPAWYCVACNKLEAHLDPHGKKLPEHQKIPRAHYEVSNSEILAHIEPIVSLEKPSCPQCHCSEYMVQNPDVMDTWFSSWLWPFATLDWPKENADLKYFYPTSSLFTASEIIFFWVARMIMAGYEFMGELPFEDVYIHGTVRDENGRKMSKSLGNALDPLELIEEYGADALRFSLIMNSGQDLFISKEKFEIGRNFANKLWNAARLILMKSDHVGADVSAEALSKIAQSANLDLASQWIISNFFLTVDSVGEAIEAYKYSDAENQIYHFFWNQFCDWYLEIIKDRWDDPVIQTIALSILVNTLKIMHPFIPFVTEELWHQIFPDAGSIAHEPWPASDKSLIKEDAAKNMQTIIDVIIAVRNLRAQWQVKPAENITCYFAAPEHKQKLLNANLAMLQKLAKIEKAVIAAELRETKNVAAAVVEDIRCALPLGDLIDIEQEKQKLKTQIQELQKLSDALQKRLGNQSFLDKAPEDVVAKEKDRLENLQSKIRELEQINASLQ